MPQITQILFENNQKDALCLYPCLFFGYVYIYIVSATKMQL